MLALAMCVDGISISHKRERYRQERSRPVRKSTVVVDRKDHSDTAEGENGGGDSDDFPEPPVGEECGELAEG